MEFVNLSNICDVYSGYAFKNFNDKKEGKPVIKIRNIKIDGTINKFDCSYTNEVPLEKFYSQKEDLYIALSGATTGKVGIMDEEGYLINQRVGVIRKKDINVPINYIKVFLDSITGKILKDAVGAAQPNISPKDILKYKFPLRRYDEMVKISNIFTNINNKINICKKYILNLDDIVKSQFIEMFDGKYEKKPLNEVCEELFAGGDVKKDKSSDVKSDKYPYPIYTNGEKDDGLYGYTSLMRVAKEAVTISGRGSIGFTCLRKEPFYPAVRLIVAVPNQELINGCYLQHFIQSKNYGGQGASIPQLTVPMIKNELIPIPPISVQNEFKQFVELIDKSKFIVQKQIKLLEELLEKKMNEYFGQ